MKKKMKMGQTPKWLAVGVAGLLVVGGIYAISNSNSNLASNNKQLGAVAASVSSDLSKPKAGGVSAGTSSVQPIINVTTWPNFELKFGAAGGENNLVAKAEYSITAQGGKIFIPVNWALMSIKNSLGQYAYPRLVENKSLDPVSVVTCNWGQTCYVIPAGKTIRFTIRQVYEPAQMFGGVYSGKLDWIYFTTVDNNDWFYYKPFPVSNAKANTITIVGEKSPYLYTTALDVDQGGVIALKGIRLTGAKPMVETSGFPQSVSQIISQDDGQITFSAKITPGVYRVYMSHPTYGNSNNAWVTVKSIPTILYPNGGETINLNGNFVVTFKPVIGDVHYINLSDESSSHAYDLSSAYLGQWPIVGQATDKQAAYFDGKKLDNLNIPSGKMFKIEICGPKLTCDKSDNYITVIKSTTTPSVTVVSPNGGEAWQVGNTYDFQWNVVGDDKIIINLDNIDTGARYGTFNSVGGIDAAPGHISWTVRNVNLPLGRYKAVISGYHNGYIDYSDNYFSIQPPVSTSTTTPIR